MDWDGLDTYTKGLTLRDKNVNDQKLITEIE